MTGVHVPYLSLCQQHVRNNVWQAATQHEHDTLLTVCNPRDLESQRINNNGSAESLCTMACTKPRHQHPCSDHTFQHCECPTTTEHQHRNRRQISGNSPAGSLTGFSCGNVLGTSENWSNLNACFAFELFLRQAITRHRISKQITKGHFKTNNPSLNPKSRNK